MRPGCGMLSSGCSSSARQPAAPRRSSAPTWRRSEALEGSGRGALGAYDAAAATDLHQFLQSVPMKEGDAWLAELMRKNTSLGLRLMEVRDSYCAEGFEWDHLQRLAQQDMKKANTQLMKQFATASLEASMAQPDAVTAAATAAGDVTAAAAVTGAAPGADGTPSAEEGAGEASGEGMKEGEGEGQPDATTPLATPPDP
ncbi:hypothetical protein TSOC_006508 [Tetrabaena socialis]|uniref:Uncharacterized protein n=1 Tax=Tetrabaena socialis TaxID=47790 RepID=A0A2J8A3F2_9CHLO|nr:hypothetical protein TSOC_006508 [Tetrabaena socialis]|eukprot:PNH07055.1 hypothetical protein TSOC_006508 [Tetrabaena socialis]